MSNNYISTGNEKKLSVDDLTPEEQAKLASLVNPDAGAGAGAGATLFGEEKFKYTPEMQDDILSIMLQDKDALSQISRVIKPGYFPMIEREKLCKLLFDYVGKYDAIPNNSWLTYEYSRTLNAEKDDVALKVKTFDNYVTMLRKRIEPACHEKKSLWDRLEHFAQYQSIRLMVLQVTKVVNESGDIKSVNDAVKVVRDYQLPSLDMPSKPYQTLEELFAAADAKKENWCVKNWLQYSCVTLITSLPKMGKSTIISELSACSIVGRDFYGMPLNPAPVLLFDPENEDNITGPRLKLALGADVDITKCKPWLFRYEKFPKPLSMSFLKQQIEDVKAKTGQDKVIVVMDTLRNCFAGGYENENDNTEMSKIFVPIKDVARETNACVIVIHHNNKASDNYAGASSILSSVDYYWNWRNQRDKKHGELTCLGRGDWVEPLELIYDPATGRNKVYTKAAQKATDIDVDLLSIPNTGGVTRDYLAEVWGVSPATASRKVSVYVDMGLVEEIKPVNRKLGKTLYRQLVDDVTSGGEVDHGVAL